MVDSTVTGMGRGPGNARTEELIIEISEIRSIEINHVPLMDLIDSYFQPLKKVNAVGVRIHIIIYLENLVSIPAIFKKC